jgi:hypothetical protein
VLLVAVASQGRSRPARKIPRQPASARHPPPGCYHLSISHSLPQGIDDFGSRFPTAEIFDALERASETDEHRDVRDRARKALDNR